MDFINLFTRELKRDSPAPELLALAIAGLAHPALDIASYLGQLDKLAERMARTLFAVPAGRPRAEHFLHVLNHELGFVGNRDNYYEPANSFLNEVLDRRTGLPIMLSLLCLAIGRRIDLDITGVGYPGHFMARYADDQGAWLLDPFHGEVLEVEAAAAYLTQIFQRPVTLMPDAHMAVSTAALTQRILNNLRNVYLSRGDYALAARVVDYLLILTPSHDNLWQERGMLHYYCEQW
jgi:regulator of sirC expression with transglutaminase-like and TPR domain